MTTFATDQLADLIRKKHQILVQLRDIGLRQQKLVDDSQTTPLLQLLGAKQHLIAALQMVERRLRPFQAEDPEQRVWRSAEDRAVCAEQAAQCQTLLTEVMQLERNQEAKMVERRDQVAAQLHRAGNAQQAVGAYRQHRTAAGPPTMPTTDSTATHLDVTSGAS